jgi:hypothetical protein
MFRTDEYSRNTKTTNQPTATYQIRQTTGEHLGHLKDLEITNYKRFFSLESLDLEISKYKRESKGRMPMKSGCVIFVNCGLFSILSIKKVKI